MKLLSPLARSARFSCLTRCGAGLLLLLSGVAARATDFSLVPREPGPGHRLLSYWWTFNKAAWELTPPDGYTLTGGGELRLASTADPSLVAVSRQTTEAERTLLKSSDAKAETDYVRKMLPAGIADIKLVSQSKNPLPVNGLANFEVVYTYTLGGQACRLSYLVSQGGERMEQLPPVPGQPTPAPTPTPAAGADGQPVRTGEFFTTVVGGTAERQPVIFGAFQQMLAMAKIKADKPESDNSDRYSSHGMLGR